MKPRMAGPQAVADHVRGALAVNWRVLVEKFGKSAVLTSLKRGLIVATLPGVYTATQPASSLRSRATALTVWSAPHGTVTGLAAAHLWGLVEAEPRRVTVQLPRDWSLRVPDWVRPLRIGAIGKRYRLGGIALAPVADAVVQVWREGKADVGASTLIAAIAHSVTSAEELIGAVARRKQLPRRGELLELIGLTGNTVTSYLEYVAWKTVFPPRLFPELQWQVARWANGRRRVLDAFDPEAMIDLEFDGGATHGGVGGFERDRERDADMRSIGIEPLHFTYRDLVERPEWCRQQYLALRAARLRTSIPPA